MLRRQFIFAPGMLMPAIKPFRGLEHRFKFYEMAKEYLPEEALAMLGMVPADGAKRFITLFTKQYFPIKGFDAYEDPMEHLTQSIPLEWHGLSQYSYEPRQWSGKLGPAQLLAEVLCEYPVENFGVAAGAGGRLAVIGEFLNRTKGNDASVLITLLPKKGYALNDLEELANYFPDLYPGLLWWCRWINAHTGNQWLDNIVHGHIDWERKLVDRLARDWPGYMEISKQMKAFDSWLGHQTDARYAEVIKYVVKTIKQEKRKRLTEILK